MDARPSVVKRADGVTVLLIEMPQSIKLAHIQVDIAVGDDYEVETAQRETAHFLEHLVASRLKSRKYATGDTKGFAEFEAIQSNASTSSVRTSYFMAGLQELLKEMIDIQVGAVADFLEYFETDDPRRYEREQSAVLRELSGKVDSPDYLMYEELNKIVFAGHPRAVSQKVDLANIEHISLKVVRDFFTKYYVAQNMLITIASPVRNLEVLEMLSGYKFKSVDTVPQRPALTHPFPSAILVHYLRLPDTTTTRLTMTWALPYRRFDKGNIIAKAVAYFLTGGFSSRLLNRLRRIDGCVYSVSAYPSADERNGNMSTFQIETSTDADKLMEVASHIIVEITRLMFTGPNEDEMRGYRRSVETRRERLPTNTAPSRYVSDYAEQQLFTDRIDRNVDYYDMVLASVTRLTVMRTCRRIFDQKPYILLYGGPTKIDTSYIIPVRVGRLMKNAATATATITNLTSVTSGSSMTSAFADHKPL